MKENKSVLMTVIAVALTLAGNPVPASAQDVKENLISGKGTGGEITTLFVSGKTSAPKLDGNEKDSVSNISGDASSGTVNTGTVAETTMAILNCTTMTELQLYDAILPKVFRVFFSIIRGFTRMTGRTLTSGKLDVQVY